MNALLHAGAALGSFLLGSIPWGVAVSRIFYRRDIRSAGSGNIGAMNALRTLGKRSAVAVLVLDAAKGVLPAILILELLHDPHLAAICGACSVLGHCFSPWLGFKGGKGVATYFGALFALSWPSGLISAAAWVAGAGTTTFSSVGSLLGCLFAPLALWFFTRDLWMLGFGLCSAALIFYTHRENIARLAAGTENGIPFLQRRRG